MISGSGSLSVIANNHVLQTAAGDLQTGGAGTVDVEAVPGSIAMTDGAVARTTGCNLRYGAALDVALGGLDAGAGLVSVTASAGTISDNGDTDKDVMGASARFSAGTGLGSGANLIDTALGTVAATGGSGGLYLADDDALILGQVGPITVGRVGTDGATRRRRTGRPQESRWSRRPRWPGWGRGSTP